LSADPDPDPVIHKSSGALVMLAGPTRTAISTSQIVAPT
jgi:hypothetical protein